VLPNWEKDRIAVENTHFSTMSTGFSTACFHRAIHEKLYTWVNIMRFDKLQLFRRFYLCGDSADRKKSAKKIGLDSAITGLRRRIRRTQK